MSFSGNNTLLIVSKQTTESEAFWLTDVAGTISSMTANFTGLSALYWGDGTTISPLSNQTVSKTFSTSANILWRFNGGNGAVKRLIIGAGANPVGGSMDVRRFVNATDIVVRRNGLRSFLWDTSSTQLTRLICTSNFLTGNIPSISSHSALVTLELGNNLFSGAMPNPSANLLLQTYFVNGNSLTGGIPSLSGNAGLHYFYCNANQLTGTIPSLTSNTLLQSFLCNTNLLAGSIPSLSSNASLLSFNCGDNQLTGSIPDLSANQELQTFYCNANQITGFSGGSVSSTINTFQAQNNSLSEDSVNNILAAFVAAGRTISAGVCLLKLEGGANAAPTGQGLNDKATLISRGWTVTTK